MTEREALLWTVADLFRQYAYARQWWAVQDRAWRRNERRLQRAAGGRRSV